jgi:hypothetical protein
MPTPVLSLSSTEELPMTATEHAFTTVGGVPTHYARSPVADYGTIGEARTFHSTLAFHQALDACFQELWQVSPHGRALAVVSAGAHVAKAGKHGLGRAFDIDSIHWHGKILVTREYPSNKKYYLGVEAVLRKHFGVVLDYHYNAAHRDHFHIDDGATVGFSKAKSTTLFMQAACQEVFGKTFKGGIDGGFGSGTQGALDEVCEDLGIATPLTDLANWNSFLDAVALHGMAITSFRRPADYQCTRR